MDTGAAVRNASCGAVVLEAARAFANFSTSAAETALAEGRGPLVFNRIRYNETLVQMVQAGANPDYQQISTTLASQAGSERTWGDVVWDFFYHLTDVIEESSPSGASMQRPPQRVLDLAMTAGTFGVRARAALDRRRSRR